jgi:Pyruvate/2-oxoacid:ferredoxin oxidoreductase gamma subunit
MNNPVKYEPLIAAEGLRQNSSLIDDACPRRCRRVRTANEIAEKEGSVRAANMVMLGALVRMKPELASLEALIHGLGEAVSARNKQLNAINVACLHKGYGLF